MRAAESLQSRIRAARRGNPQGLGELYDEYGTLVYAVAFSVLRNVADAEDVVGDLPVALSVELGRFTFAGQPAFESWLRRVTLRRAFSMLERRRTRNERLQTFRPAFRAFMRQRCEPPPVDLDLDLEQALEQLSETTRLILLLHDIEGFTHNEIGEVLGLNASPVHSA